MKNKKLFLLIILLVITIGIGLYLFLVQKDKGVIEAEKDKGMTESDVTDTAGVTDLEEQIFNITPPADFNEYQLARFNEKLEVLKEMHAQDKEDARFWIGLGNLKNFVRDYQGAIAAYQKCLEISPLDIVANVNIADTYEKKLKDLSKAEEYYKKAIDNNFTSPDLYNRLARLYYLKMERPADAEKTFLEGLEKTNNYPDLLVGLINFYDKQNRTEDKIKYIKILLELYPDNQLYQQEYSKFIK
jgi:tetratricopeptide (TPR) repeat protein